MSDSGQLRKFATFIYIKSQFKNSCVYKYTQQSLSEKTGISRSAIRKYVKFFLDSGWCRLDHGNLIFNKMRVLDKNEKRIISDVKIRIGIKELIIDLQLLLLKHKQAQFNRIVRLGIEIKDPKSIKPHQSANRIVKKYGYNVDKLPSERAKLQISIKKLSEWLNCSVGKVSQLLKSLQKRGLISITKVRNIVGYSKTFEGAKALLNMNENSYYSRGYIVKVSCNYYNF